MASKNPEDNIPDDLLCPVCFELPDFEVYQCVDGHVLCKICFFKLKECPQCRKLLSLTPPIRNRYFEAQLESLKIDCPFKSNGCTVKLRKSACNEHKNLCYYNKARFGEFVDICRLLGFANCKFLVNNGNTKDAVEHLVTKHGCSLVDSSKFNLKLVSSPYSSIPATQTREFWTPVITKLEDKQCFILSMALINNDKCLGWLTLYLPFVSNCDDVNKAASHLEVAYELNRKLNSRHSLSIYQTPATLHEIQEKSTAMTYSLYYMNWLTSLFAENGVLNIVLEIKNEENTSKSEATLLTIPCAKVVYLKKPKITVWDHNQGSPEAKSILSRQETEFKSNRNSLRVLIEKILNGEKPSSLSTDDIEWIKNGSLFYIARDGSTEIVQRLLKAGINFNIVSTEGYSPLFWAIRDNDKEIGLEKAKLLIENGGDFKLLSKQGESLLHHACKHSNAAAVDYLIKKGLSVNAMDCNGMTPLHYACGNTTWFSVEVVKALLERGADCFLKSKDGKTAADLAKNYLIRQTIERYQ